MNLTEEQQKIGRRNFLKAIAGAPALVALGAAALTRGPVRGGPVRIALVGTGCLLLFLGWIKPESGPL